MQQIALFLCRYREQWLSLSELDREQAVGTILRSVQGVVGNKVRLAGAAFNDRAGADPSAHDFIMVFHADTAEDSKHLSATLLETGWHEHFDTQSIGGSALSLAGLLRDCAGRPGLLEPSEAISASLSFQKRKLRSLDLELSYFEVGSGDPILFLHGDLASSYLWRNVVPHVSDLGRCIAIDLIGAGDSDKIPDARPGAYGYFAHLAYLEAAIESLGVTGRVTIVGHDWGATLGMDWAVRHSERIAGLAFTEAVVPPFGWSDFPPAATPLFKLIKSPEGLAAVMDRNAFVESYQNGMRRLVSPAEWAEVRRPYAAPGPGRLPTYDWPNSVPLGGEPCDVHEAITSVAERMAAASFPKLFINSTPGGIMNGRRGDLVRRWAGIEEVTVRGFHWPPEDDPHNLGRHLRGWMLRHGAID